MFRHLHSFMWCNYKGSNLSEFIREISSKVSHIHISDAAGESDEGLQVGEGDLNFSEILQAISSSKRYNTTSRNLART